MRLHQPSHEQRPAAQELDESALHAGRRLLHVVVVERCFAEPRRAMVIALSAPTRTPRARSSIVSSTRSCRRRPHRTRATCGSRRASRNSARADLHRRPASGPGSALRRRGVRASEARGRTPESCRETATCPRAEGRPAGSARSGSGDPRSTSASREPSRRGCPPRRW